MPTFKGDYLHYRTDARQAENLRQLFDGFNDLVKQINFTLNNLDEENLSEVFSNSFLSNNGKGG